MLWMGEFEATVAKVDPIRGVLKVSLETGVELDVGPEELTTKPLKEEIECRKREEE